MFNNNDYLNEKNKDQIERLLQNAENMAKKVKDFERAQQLYEEVITLAPTNPYGWFGMASLITDEFSIFSKKKIEAAQDYVDKALRVASDAEAQKIQIEWNRYLEEFNFQCKEIQNRIEKSEARIGELRYRNVELTHDLKRYRKQKQQKQDLFNIIAGIISAALFICLIWVLGITNTQNEMFMIIACFLVPALAFILLTTNFLKISRRLHEKIYKKEQGQIEATEAAYKKNEDDIHQLEQEIENLYRKMA